MHIQDLQMPTKGAKKEVLKELFRLHFFLFCFSNFPDFVAYNVEIYACLPIHLHSDLMLHVLVNADEHDM